MEKTDMEKNKISSLIRAFLGLFLIAIALNSGFVLLPAKAEEITKVEITGPEIIVKAGEYASDGYNRIDEYSIIVPYNDYSDPFPADVAFVIDCGVGATPRYKIFYDMYGTFTKTGTYYYDVHYWIDPSYTLPEDLSKLTVTYNGQKISTFESDIDAESGVHDLDIYIPVTVLDADDTSITPAASPTPSAAPTATPTATPTPAITLTKVEVTGPEIIVKVGEHASDGYSRIDENKIIVPYGEGGDLNPSDVVFIMDYGASFTPRYRAFSDTSGTFTKTRPYYYDVHYWIDPKYALPEDLSKLTVTYNGQKISFIESDIDAASGVRDLSIYIPVTVLDADATITTPTASPTPTTAPTATPTTAPTATPTAAPTATPTAAPTATPTAAPTATPTAAPTATPAAEPTDTPAADPTDTPAAEPTDTPAADPTDTPAEPTDTPAAEPTDTPAEPTDTPAAEPTDTPAAVTATPVPAATQAPDATATPVPTTEAGATVTPAPTTVPATTQTPDVTPTVTPGESAEDTDSPLLIVIRIILVVIAIALVGGICSEVKKYNEAKKKENE